MLDAHELLLFSGVVLCFMLFSFACSNRVVFVVLAHWQPLRAALVDTSWSVLELSPLTGLSLGLSSPVLSSFSLADPAVMPCCQCQASRTCARCSCKRARKVCTDCYPGRNHPSTCRNKSDSAGDADTLGTQEAISAPLSDTCGLVASTGAAPSPASSVTGSASQPAVDLPAIQSACSGDEPSLHGVSLVEGPTRVEDHTPSDSSVRNTDRAPVQVDAVQCLNIRNVYDEVVHWRKRFFKVPTGSVGKAFVRTMAGLLQTYADSGGRDDTELYRFAVLPSLVLQVPHHRSGNKENATHLRRRMDLWEADELTSLLEEGQCLQRNILVGCPGGKPQGETDNARLFGICHPVEYMMPFGCCSWARLRQRWVS